MTPAAIDVLPLASWMEDAVGARQDRVPMKGEMSTFVTARPSQPYTGTQREDVARNSRPSGRLWTALS